MGEKKRERERATIKKRYKRQRMLRSVLLLKLKLSRSAYDTDPHDQFILVLARPLTPKGNAASWVAYESNVTMLQFRGMPSRYILAKLPHVLFAEIVWV